jgi:hypothetical protein
MVPVHHHRQFVPAQVSSNLTLLCQILPHPESVQGYNSQIALLDEHDLPFVTIEIDLLVLLLWWRTIQLPDLRRRIGEVEGVQKGLLRKEVCFLKID